MSAIEVPASIKTVTWPPRIIASIIFLVGSFGVLAAAQTLRSREAPSIAAIEALLLPGTHTFFLHDRETEQCMGELHIHFESGASYDLDLRGSLIGHVGGKAAVIDFGANAVFSEYRLLERLEGNIGIRNADSLQFSGDTMRLYFVRSGVGARSKTPIPRPIFLMKGADSTAARYQLAAPSNVRRFLAPLAELVTASKLSVLPSSGDEAPPCELNAQYNQAFGPDLSALERIIVESGRAL